MTTGGEATKAQENRRWRRFKQNRSAWIGGALVAVMVTMALGGSWLAPYAPNDVHEQFASPSWRHWFGTDIQRYDVWSRVIHGARLSLLAGGVSIALAMSAGVPMGLAAGYLGGRWDALLMRTIDVALAFPSILLALLAATAISRGWGAVVLSVGLINVPVFARQIRATVLGIRQQEYVTASRALGGSPLHIVGRVILPGLVSPLVVLATLGLGSAILEVAALSFLGVGGDPTEPEWGAMMALAKESLGTSIWPALGPGLAISLTILGFNLLGDALRDALDPRLSHD